MAFCKSYCELCLWTQFNSCWVFWENYGNICWLDNCFSCIRIHQANEDQHLPIPASVLPYVDATWRYYSPRNPNQNVQFHRSTQIHQWYCYSHKQSLWEYERVLPNWKGRNKCHKNMGMTSTVHNTTYASKVSWHNKWSQIWICFYRTPVCCSDFSAWKLYENFTSHSQRNILE